MQLDIKKILVDGKRIGDVIGYQITDFPGKNERKATLYYFSGGKERVLTCELEAISFDD